MPYLLTKFCARGLKARLNGFLRAQSAATAVEFALVAPLLFNPSVEEILLLQAVAPLS